MHMPLISCSLLAARCPPLPQKNAIAALTATIESSNEAVGVALKNGVVRPLSQEGAAAACCRRLARLWS